MKMFKIAAASAVLALASGYASAATTTMSGVTAPLAAPITISMTSALSMPSLIIPETGAGDSSVTLPPNGSAISYTGGGGGATATTGSVGVVSVDGEDTYAFNISAVGTPVTGGTGLTLDNFTFFETGGLTATQFTLGVGVPTVLKVGATLTASAGATADTFDVAVTVVYAP